MKNDSIYFCRCIFKSEMKLFCLLLSGLLFSPHAFSQENYEIEVYSSETMNKGIFSAELHSNYTPKGADPENDVRPSENAFHETAEFIYGAGNNTEIGFYIFTNIHSAYGWQWVGDHLRAKVRAPEKWKLPVGLSLSGEFGYQRREYSADIWNMELRPIIDKDFKRIYFSFNPVLGKSFKGVGAGSGFDFEPCFKFSIHATKKMDIGAEYYGATGEIFRPDDAALQQHALYAAFDLKPNERWEFNAGAGWGLTKATDGLVIKFIAGRKIGKIKSEAEK